jgi:hypothetical protein
MWPPMNCMMVPSVFFTAVDNRRYKRLLYDVLDHDPTHDDIRAFLRRLHTALSARDLTLFGVTTDGSALSPLPLREVFGKVQLTFRTPRMAIHVFFQGGILRTPSYPQPWYVGIA